MTGENPWKHAVAAGHAHPGPGSQTEGQVYSGGRRQKQAGPPAPAGHVWQQF